MQHRLTFELYFEAICMDFSFEIRCTFRIKVQRPSPKNRETVGGQCAKTKMPIHTTTLFTYLGGLLYQRTYKKNKSGSNENKGYPHLLKLLC